MGGAGGLTVSAAVVDIGAIVAVAVSKPVVRHGGVVAVVDEKGVVVDAVKEVDHLVDGERAAAVVVEERVERLELRPGGRLGLQRNPDMRARRFRAPVRG